MYNKLKGYYLNLYLCLTCRRKWEPMSQLTLEYIRKVFNYLGLKSEWTKRNAISSDKDRSNALLSDMIKGDKPFMVARLGCFELGIVGIYQSKLTGSTPILSYLAGKISPWWWDSTLSMQICNNAGFFPSSPTKLDQFGALMNEDLAYVDVLGSWMTYEDRLPQLDSAHRVELHDLEPFFSANPWTHALAGKKVLIVHPFTHSIQYQHSHLQHIFPDGLMPEFELITIKAVQTIAGEITNFPDWFAALDHMKEQMDTVDFDVCIIGAGAYGLPLAAHAKRRGKKAIHLGGVTQMLFGIKGRRWEESDEWPYHELFNPYWVRPCASELPAKAIKVEGACYW